ncbi:MAG: AraC family transcriptional regulator [Bacteroidota bacterium]
MEEEIFCLPDHFLQRNTTVASGSQFCQLYESNRAIYKSKVELNSYLFSFLQEGQKRIHHAQNIASLTPSHFLLLKPGRCLMTERLSLQGNYESLLFFFYPDNLQELAEKYDWRADYQEERDFMVFKRDKVLIQFTHSLIALYSSGIYTGDLIRIKLEEMLVYLLQKEGQKVLDFLLQPSASRPENHLQQVVSKHVYHKLSLDELAFLSHMSVSTFKRKFKEAYDTSPAKWFQLKRLEKAKQQLVEHHASPGELYLEAGFENFSSFSQAFKKEFGYPPSQYTVNKS